MTDDETQRPRQARPRAPEVRLLPPPEPDDPWPDDDEPEPDGEPERDDEPESGDGPGDVPEPDDDEPDDEPDLVGEVEADHLSAEGRVRLWLEYAESDHAVRVRQDWLRHPESLPDHRGREVTVRPPPKEPRRPLPKELGAMWLARRQARVDARAAANDDFLAALTKPLPTPEPDARSA